MESEDIKRKYNSTCRKKLVSKIDKIKDKPKLYILYNIITEDIGNNFSSNQNGIFINMNILSDKCIEKLTNLLEDKINNIIVSETDKINYKAYKLDDMDMISEMGQKLSNQEKNIIKRIRNKSNSS
jgi:hypothetical protein